MRAFRSILAVSTVAFAASAAFAGLNTTNTNGGIIQITATDSDGNTATWSPDASNAQPTGDPENPSYTWSDTAGYQGWDLNGAGPEDDVLVFEVTAANADYIADPQINLGFTLVAGNAATTDFLVQSALLTFSTLTNPTASSSGDLTVTDSFAAGGTGATMSKILPGGMYRSEYNGFVPTGTPYAELINTFSATTLQNTNSAGDSKNDPIVGSVNDMSAQVNFRLTRRDTASGTTTYSIVPEPTSLVLLAIGALALRRSR